MNRSILHIAIPSIISNITIPLLALVDTTIAGHLGAAAYIGAIAVGGMIFNMAYWLFGFLRMGTGGLTAQAYGSGAKAEPLRVLLRSLSLAGAVSLVLIVLQEPIVHTVFRFVEATPEVERMARSYFHILIWGAPAVLGLYSFTGWFLGMQNARIPMATAIVQNVVNIAVSLSLVLGLGWKVEGVATGTLVAQYAGLLMAVMLWRRCSKPCPWAEVRQGLFAGSALKKFFSVNRDIFLRTLCLIAVTSYFTSAGSAQGELALAANTLLMQFFVFFSYVMDGFAYAGEALGGRFCGAHDSRSFVLLTRRLFVWGGALVAVYTAVYALTGSTIVGLLTDERQVVSTAVGFLPFAVAVPVMSFAAFLFDGLFIGVTATREMLVSMFVAMLVFFGVIFLYPSSNVVLWSAFLAYLFCRGVVQAALFPRIRHKVG